jgi:hypothetical protein
VEAEELVPLAEKLRELLALRALGDADPPRDRLRALSARFPGALRELDRVPLETLAERLEAVEAAIAGGPIPGWAKPASRYHGWLRVALRLRAEAARSEEAAAAWAAVYLPAFAGDPGRERLSLQVLRLLIAPPDGRLARVAADLAAEDAGTDAETLLSLLYGR